MVVKKNMPNKPMTSMDGLGLQYGILTYIWLIFMVNVGN